MDHPHDSSRRRFVRETSVLGLAVALGPAALREVFARTTSRATREADTMTGTIAPPAAAGTAAGAADVRPFRFSVADADIADLRRRVGATKWPERETVDGSTRRECQLATMQKLARYWATEYDWRKCEAKLNAVPQFMTEIDGLDIHFIHVRSKQRKCAAAHRHARLARLRHRAAEDHRAAHQSHRPWRHRG